MGEISQIALYTISGNNLFRQGIKNILTEEIGTSVKGCFKDCDSALNYFCHDSSFQKNNNVVFIEDLSFCKKQTLKLKNNLHSCFRLSNIKTIVYTNSHDGEYLAKLKQLEVNAILHDEETPLREALQAGGRSSVVVDGKREGGKQKSPPKADAPLAQVVSSQKSVLGSPISRGRQDFDKLNLTAQQQGKRSEISELSSLNSENFLNFSLPERKWNTEEEKAGNSALCVYKKLLDILSLVIIEKTYCAEKVNALISGHIWARSENERLIIPLENELKINNAGIDRHALGTVKQKIRGLIVSAMPLIASAIMMLFPDDAISFDKKEFLDINAENPYGLLCENSGIDNYDLIILDDNDDKVIGESLLNIATRNLNLPTKNESKKVVNKNFGSKVILYTRSKDILYLRRLRDKSVLGLLHEESLAGAVKPLFEGNNYVDPSIENKIREYNKYLIAHPLSRLTYCQLKVLKEIAEGWKNRSITEKLYMTIDAVEKAKGRIEHALNIYSDELTHFAIENRDEIKYLLEFPLKEDTSLEKRNRKI